FTSRHGGVSSGPYASLNLGRFTDDNRAAVRENRQRLQGLLGVRFVYGRQVHGARVMRVDQARGEPAALVGPMDPASPADPTDPAHPAAPADPADPAAPAEADGQATSAHGVAPMVLTADCLPIAVAGGGAVAMLRAGW